MTRTRGRRPGLAALLLFALGGCTEVGGALDRSGDFVGRQLGAGAPARPPDLREESPPSPTPAEVHAAAAAKLREALDRRDRATTDADREAAAAEIVAAAERGNSDARYLVGAGDLLLPAPQRDPSRAAEWLARAATQGHARAQFALAQLYASGDGVARDAAWANVWFARAARRGHPSAQYTLALRQIAGEGGPADPADAYFWLALAVAAGYPDASRYRDALCAQLPAERRAALGDDARRWRTVSAEPWPDPPLIRFVQIALVARGVDPGPPDGALGPRTHAALAAWASREGVSSGDLTPATVARLRGR